MIVRSLQIEKERHVKRLITLISAMLIATPAFADKPVPWAVGFQEPVTPLAHEAFWFHNVILMPIITIISVFVTILLLYVMVKYRKSSNPVPRKFTHNFTVEALWTGIPVLILIFIAIFSFRLLYMFDSEPNLPAISENQSKPWYEVDEEAAKKGWINVKAQGHQWYWTYSFPDIKDADGYEVAFQSNGIHKGLPTDKAKYEALGRTDFDRQPKNLAVDYPLVLPEKRYIRYYTAAADVIHAFAMPAFAVKTDAIPGRLNQGWFYVEKTGVYYGQCSELCGKDHAYMPIEIRVVSQAKFDRWIELMAEGEWDAAYDIVADKTQLASVATTEILEE